MITVVIVGILAALAAYGVIKYINLSKSSEPIQMIGSIKAAQEAYRADMLSYLDVSGSHDITAASYFPATTTAGKKTRSWQEVVGSETPIGLGFKRLGVNPDGPVRYIYASAAGSVSEKPAGHQLPTESVLNWPTAAIGQPWYVVAAKGDMDGDGLDSAYAAASFTSQIFIDHLREGE